MINIFSDPEIFFFKDQICLFDERIFHVLETLSSHNFQEIGLKTKKMLMPELKIEVIDFFR